MSSKEEAYYTLLLRQYIEGTISEDDKFILEKRALDDPFLFEALEGYQNNEKQSLDEVLLLKSKINKAKETKKSKRIPLYSYGIAASLILLLGIGLWFLNDATNEEESFAIHTSVNEGGNENQKILDVLVQNNDEAGEVRTPDKQYDTPKAVISQTDNELIKEQLKVKQTPTSVIEPTKTYAKQQSPPSVNNTQILYSKNESTPSPTADIATILNQDKTNIQADAQSIEEEQIFEEVVEEEFTRQPVAARNQVSKILSPEGISIPKEEYYPSLDGKIMIAPEGGITKLLNSLNGDKQRRERSEIDSKQFSTISFKLTQDGEPIELKLISTDDSECGKKLLKAIEIERKWYTIPKNFESSIILKLPCK